ncbi:MAG: RNA methyltransferase [Rhodocyclaceae bacterium]|nr:RNA methyltransferase [Rhodocyclaceae bacterium]
MRIAHLRQHLFAAGAKPGHEACLLRAWLKGLPLASGRLASADCLPAALRAALPGLNEALDGLASLCSRHDAADGSSRLLVRLADGQMIESVLLPKGGLCVSTQVGCAVGCTFCMTGRSGLLRQLTSGEIVAQLVLARRLQPVRKVVFMGMGEPAHNLDDVLEAIELLGTQGDIGHKNLVFSTVGTRRAFDRLGQGAVKPALALSLHSADPTLRAQLLPKAPRIEPAALVDYADAYARATGYPVQYQWTLIEGVNDDDAAIEAAGRLLAGRYGLINFIPYNETAGDGLRRPGPARLARIAAIMKRHGVLAKFRQSAGQEVEGGCGQLRARALAEKQPATGWRP